MRFYENHTNGELDKYPHPDDRFLVEGLAADGTWYKVGAYRTRGEAGKYGKFECVRYNRTTCCRITDTVIRQYKPHAKHISFVDQMDSTR